VNSWSFFSQDRRHYIYPNTVLYEHRVVDEVGGQVFATNLELKICSCSLASITYIVLVSLILTGYLQDSPLFFVVRRQTSHTSVSWDGVFNNTMSVPWSIWHRRLTYTRAVYANSFLALWVFSIIIIFGVNPLLGAMHGTGSGVKLKGTSILMYPPQCASANGKRIRIMFYPCPSPSLGTVIQARPAGGDRLPMLRFVPLSTLTCYSVLRPHP
jgi:hypothetical protein